MKSKMLLWIFVFFLLFSFVYAQPPFQEGTANEGMILEYPKYDIIKNSQNFTLHTHVIYTTNGTIVDNTSTQCRLDLYNKNGQHILKENMGYEDIEFELYIGESNFTRNGEYAYIIQCNSTAAGGFVEVTN